MGKDKWTKLCRHLATGVSQEEIIRLQSMTSSGQEIHIYFLKWWLYKHTNNIDPTWENSSQQLTDVDING